MSDPNFFPARRSVAGAAQILGLAEHEIAILVQARHLKPLGNPVPNAPKWFATVTLLEYAHDLSWLDKATRIIYAYNRQRNARVSAQIKHSEETVLSTATPHPPVPG